MKTVLSALALLMLAAPACHGSRSGDEGGSKQDACGPTCMGQRDGGDLDSGGAGGGDPDAGSGKDATVPDAGSGKDATVPDAGDTCSLPPETGPCDGAFARYYFDAQSGACKSFSYGGCEGNANNFETATVCLAACTTQPSGESACKVGDAVYPSGAGGISDPHSCNTCACQNGQVSSCTEINCPNECPPDRKPSTSCAVCGPADGCEVLEHGCFKVCDQASECSEPGLSLCVDNACRNLCG